MTDFLFLVWNNMPWVWLMLTVIFAIIESLTLSLTTIWFALGAFVMIFLSLTPLPFQAQLILFALISCALLIFTRPFAMQKINLKKTATNAGSLVGKEVVVQDDVQEFQKGSVRINGVVWSARSESGESITYGTKCSIADIEGNTLVLRRSL